MKTGALILDSTANARVGMLAGISLGDVKNPATRQRPATASLPDFDLSKIMARVAVEHPDWCQTRLDAAERDYRRYAMLAKLYRDVFPTKDADQVWHCHILCTKDYMRDCDCYYGYYLHHNAGVEPETNDLARLQRLHQKHFGTDPGEIAALSVCNGGCCDGCE